MSPVTGLDPAVLARTYSVRGLVDYGPHRGRGVMFATGAGLMLAAMDQMPSVRWAIDCSGGKPGPHALVSSWCETLPGVCSHVAVVAWFTITNPVGFVRVMLAPLDPDRLAVYSHPPLGVGITCDTMGELVEQSAKLDTV